MCVCLCVWVCVCKCVHLHACVCVCIRGMKPHEEPNLFGSLIIEIISPAVNREAKCPTEAWGEKTAITAQSLLQSEQRETGGEVS